MDNACSVSIIVPIYNVEKYLYESLQSLKKQTFPVFEVIMIDDGSTDESSEIAIKIAEEEKHNIQIRINLTTTLIFFFKTIPLLLLYLL